ncbi:MAG: O-antigen ligase family protein [Pseudomonadota bacterium]
MRPVPTDSAALHLQPAQPWWRPSTTPRMAGSHGGGAPVAAMRDDSSLPFRMLMLFTFILLLAPQQLFPVLAPLRIALLVAGLAMLTYVGNRLSNQKPMLDIAPGIKPATLLAGWAVLTVPLSFWPGGSVNFLLSEFFKTLVVFLLLAHVVDSGNKLLRLSWALVIMAVPLALSTLSNFATGNYLSSDRIVGYNAPLTTNPNDMALMLNLILPFAFALLLSAKSFMTKLILGAAIFILIGAIIVTFSRAGFLALAFIILMYMWLVRNRPQRWIIPVAFVLGLCALPLVPTTYYDRISTITEIESDETRSAQTRWRDYAVASRLVLSDPLIGAGVGMSIFAMNEARGETSTEIHNVYLQYAVELGIPGLVLFLLLFRTCLGNTKDALTRLRQHPELTTLFYLAEAIRVSLLAYAIEAMFHPVAYAFYFYYIAGLAVALTTVCDRELARLLPPQPDSRNVPRAAASPQKALPLLSQP